jgi:prepilin signal peptidase PulO-like enzyme (type II secretory pathway)
MLASAAGPDSSNANVELVLIGAAVFLVIGAIAFLPIMVSRSVRPRKNESIIAAIVLWGLITGSSVIYSIMQQMNRLLRPARCGERCSDLSNCFLGRDDGGLRRDSALVEPTTGDGTGQAMTGSVRFQGDCFRKGIPLR